MFGKIIKTKLLKIIIKFLLKKRLIIIIRLVIKLNKINNKTTNTNIELFINIKNFFQ